MSDFYAEDIQVARELLAEFGETVTVERLRADGVVTDSDKPWRPETPDPGDVAAEDSFEAYAAFVPVQSGQSARELTYQYDVYIQPVNRDNEVINNCRIVRPNGKVYAILNAPALEIKSGQIVLYTCEVNQWPGR